MPESSTSLQIEITENALIVRGEIPVAAMEGISAIAKTQGFDQIYAGACRPLGATFVITSAERQPHLQNDIKARAEKAAAGGRFEAWLHGPDTGTSSLTIAEILSGRTGLVGSFGRSTPRDPSDFWRCLNLLEAVPEWRSRLSEVAAAEPSWAALIERWGEVEALYREEAPTGRAPRCYDLMQELVR